jgi:hypothetical protein
MKPEYNNVRLVAAEAEAIAILGGQPGEGGPIARILAPCIECNGQSIVRCRRVNYEHSIGPAL